ncbi:unnamed protein product, partial [marine sediment metagenome]
SCTGNGTALTWNTYTNEDATIISGIYAGSNYGSDPRLQVGLKSVIGPTAKFLIDFNVSNYIPQGANVIEATLRLYLEEIHGTSPAIYIGWVTGSWGQSSVTWNSSASASYYTARSHSLPSSLGYVYLDVTPEVQKMVDLGLNEGFKIWSANESTVAWVEFSSRENPNSSSRSAYLVVEYTP